MDSQSGKNCLEENVGKTMNSLSSKNCREGNLGMKWTVKYYLKKYYEARNTMDSQSSKN